MICWDTDFSVAALVYRSPRGICRMAEVCMIMDRNEGLHRPSTNAFLQVGGMC